MLILLTRAHFLGRVLLLTAGGLSVFYTSPPPTRAAAITGEMAISSPDYEAWDAAVRAHVRPTEIRGIGLNSVDYQGKCCCCCRGRGVVQVGPACEHARQVCMAGASCCCTQWKVYALARKQQLEAVEFVRSLKTSASLPTSEVMYTRYLVSGQSLIRTSL